MPDDGALEARVRRLEDLEEIRALLDAYLHHLDRGEFAEYAALYADDGQMRLGPARADGRGEIERVAREQFGGGSQFYGDDLGGIHIASDPRIVLDGDAATAEVMWTLIVRDADGKPHVSMVGHHADELVREHGRWRIARRRGFLDIT